MALPAFEAAIARRAMMTEPTDSIEPPSRDAVARLAYQLYNMRGCQDGRDVEDWLIAERELEELYRDYQHYR